MASVSIAPQLSPVRPLAPIDLSSPIREEEIEAIMRKMRRAKIMESTLESGAPETKEEAALSNPSTPARSPADEPTTFDNFSKKHVSTVEHVEQLEPIAEDAASDSEEVEECCFSKASPTKKKHAGAATGVVGKGKIATKVEHEQQQRTSGSKAITPMIRSHLDKEPNLLEAVYIVEPKIVNASETVTTEDTDLLHSREVRAYELVERGGITAHAQSLAAKNSQARIQEEKQAQSHLDKEKNFEQAVGIIEPKIVNASDSVTKEDADFLHSRDNRAHKVVPATITAIAQSLASRNFRATSDAHSKENKEEKYEDAVEDFEPKVIVVSNMIT